MFHVAKRCKMALATLSGEADIILCDDSHLSQNGYGKDLVFLGNIYKK